jgi:nitrate/TMAO reductase-like tetraheme cytochrome c subunit
MNTLDRLRMLKRLQLTACGLLGLLLLSVLFVVPASAQQEYSGEGAAACLECHESERVMGIRDTPHANFDDPKSPASREQCESCHGPSATHMQFPMQVGNIVFTQHGKTPIHDRNQVCLECHNEGEQAHWNEGAHGKELSCATCHIMHKPADPSLVQKNQARDCGECHTDILETAPDATTHPLTGENAMYCTECHNPHGPTNLKSCISCHTQDPPTLAKQSPKAQEYHGRAVSQKIDCTDCHKGFVHAMEPITLGPPPSERENAHP